MSPQTSNVNIKAGTPEILEEDGVRTLRITAHLIGYKDGDISVRPAEAKLLLVNKDNDVIETFNLPESVDPFTVEANISEDGMLTVMAPLTC
nr:small heat shock protein [Arenicola marina]